MNTVLITGANRGIGLEFVKQYNKDGWCVLACCRNPEYAIELEKIKGGNIEIIQLDVNDFDNISQLGVQYRERPIDLLINNAGISSTDDDFKTISHEMILTTLRTNTLAPILIAQALINSVALGHRKIIINISSYYGSIGFYDNTDYMAYQISKTALNSATKNMAKSLKSKNIIAISIDPGWVKTDMGGEEAILMPHESVSGMRNIFDKLTLSDSGKFFRYDGNLLPW
ncbi:MAG: SDR family oxidoreductase [Legionellales bacterium]|nr:SDR family oxidoreductase [Legionellales bacterium]